MSAAVLRDAPAARPRQLGALVRVELRRTLRSWRSFGMYVLALLPVVPFAVQALIWRVRPDLLQDYEPTSAFAGVFQALVVRLVIYLSCLGVFTNLFRGDINDRTLHLYFLVPARRDLIVLGKYLAGVIAVTAVIALSTTATFVLAYMSAGGAGRHTGELLWYLLVVVLAVAGYGSVFLLLGLLWRNSYLPAVAIWFWELLNPYLPAGLKQVSVIHYLLSLCPVAVSTGPFAILGEPAPTWLAVPGVALLSAVFVTLAARRARRFEVNYAGD